MDERQPLEILTTPNFALTNAADDYIAAAVWDEEGSVEWPDRRWSDSSLPFWMEEDAWEEAQRSLVYEAPNSDPVSDKNIQSSTNLPAVRALEVRMGLLSMQNGRSENSLGLTPPPSEVQSDAVVARKGRNKRPGKRPSKRVREAAQPRGRRRTDTREEQKKKLARRNKQRCQELEHLDFSMLASTRPVATGWHGRAASKSFLDVLTAAWKSGAIFAKMKGMHLTPYTSDAQGKPQAVAFIDSCNLKFAYRTFRIAAIEQHAEALNQAIDDLLGDHLVHTKYQAAYEGDEKGKKRPRGNHFNCNLGYYKPYSEKPHLTGWHQKHMQRVDAFLSTPIVQIVIALASSVLEQHFPGVARRYRHSQTWHEQHSGISSHFGLFWNMCINGIFPGQERIYCAPHIDHKNVVGICIVLVYQLKNGQYRPCLQGIASHQPSTPAQFDHKTRSWLALWEAGLVVELPPWTMLLYPSSLIHHFNIDIHGKCYHNGTHPSALPANLFALEFHTNQNLNPGDPFGRGSIVFYNQAAMFYGPELGYHTLEEARSSGHSGATDFAADIRRSFFS